MARSRTYQSECEFIHIPHDSRERFLAHHVFLGKGGVAMAGISAWSRAYRVERNRSPLHLALYTLEGSALLSVNHGKPRGLEAGDLFIAPSQSIYTYRTRGVRWSAAWLHLIPGPRWDPLMESQPLVRKALSTERIVRAMTGYMEESAPRGGDSTPAMQAYVDLMLLYLQRDLENGNPRLAERNRRLKGILDGVRNDLRQEWTVAKLASLAGVSRAQLHRILPELTGRSPMKMTESLRMDRASELLIYSSHTLAGIAEEVGYDNAFSFSKAFKRHTGSSPAEFRRRAVMGE